MPPSRPLKKPRAAPAPRLAPYQGRITSRPLSPVAWSRHLGRSAAPPLHRGVLSRAGGVCARSLRLPSSRGCRGPLAAPGQSGRPCRLHWTHTSHNRPAFLRHSTTRRRDATRDSVTPLPPRRTTRRRAALSAAVDPRGRLTPGAEPSRDHSFPKQLPAARPAHDDPLRTTILTVESFQSSFAPIGRSASLQTVPTPSGRRQQPFSPQRPPRPQGLLHEAFELEGQRRRSRGTSHSRRVDDGLAKPRLSRTHAARVAPHTTLTHEEKEFDGHCVIGFERDRLMRKS